MKRSSPINKDLLSALLLIGATLAALAAANGPLAARYADFLHASLSGVSFHAFVADGLMALFFLLVGLEIKREWYEGRLSCPAERRLPFIAAAAGMAFPALVYLVIVRGHPTLHHGWAIPAATDIAFAVGVLALLGSRAPPSIKLLLVTIAIVDDIGAVAIIAIAYTRTLDPVALGAAAAILAAMAALGQFGVRRLWPYMAGFVALWIAVHASGVHSTISGVLAALTIPLGRGEARSPLKRLERRIHPWVVLGIVPLFGFVSAGVALGGGPTLQPLPLAIAAGLFVGKQAGVFGSIWLAVRLGVAPRPAGASWAHLYGAALLCGIGFTMSLFIGALAFPGNDAAVEAAKLGTLGGSLLSALAGAMVLALAKPLACPPEDSAEAAELFAADEL